MKLWLRQTLLSLFIVLLSVSACLYFFTAMQTESLLHQAQESGKGSLNAFCEHLTTRNRNSLPNKDNDPTTRTALLQYTFSTYAHVLQSSESAFSLAVKGNYLYNISPADPRALLPLAEGDISGCRTVLLDHGPYLIFAKRLTVLETPALVYLTQNISQVYGEINRLTRTAQFSLGACLLLCACLLPLFFRRSLRPLKRLTRITGEIAGGQYALRAEIHSPDEVGELAAAFDTMAETVEQKILSLEDLRFPAPLGGDQLCLWPADWQRVRLCPRYRDAHRTPRLPVPGNGP